MKKQRDKKGDTMTRGRVLSIALIIVGTLLIGFASYRLIAGEIEYAVARNEYDELRDIFESVPLPHIVLPPEIPQPPEAIAPNGQSPAPEITTNEDPLPARDAKPLPRQNPMEALMEINPDFVGWIEIENLISYPVVQGSNNSRYLNTTFQGQRNSSGTIFLDYRNSSDFDHQVSFIYGHNMRDGSMFAPLHRLRDPVFLSQHQYITITKPDWTVFTYRIFAARIVNARDVENNPGRLTASAVIGAAYGAPGDAEHILILSTCTLSADDGERLRIYAALT